MMVLIVPLGNLFGMRRCTHVHNFMTVAQTGHEIYLFKVSAFLFDSGITIYYIYFRITLSRIRMCWKMICKFDLLLKTFFYPWPCFNRSALLIYFYLLKFMYSYFSCLLYVLQFIMILNILLLISVCLFSPSVFYCLPVRHLVTGFERCIIKKVIIMLFISWHTLEPFLIYFFSLFWHMNQNSVGWLEPK